MPGLSYRTSIGAAAAAATERIVNAPLQEGIRAGAQNAAELDAMPTGILVGAALRDDPRSVPRIQRDDMIMWALTDPQRATRVVMDTSAASIDKGKEFVMAEAALFIGSGEQARGREKLARKDICALVKRYRNRDSSVGPCVANT